MLRAFADLGFRWKIALPILLLAALLVAMGALGMRGITQVAESSTTLTNRHLPAISLLLNADRDLYQAFVAERSLLDEDSAAYAEKLRVYHAENLQQAYDRVHKFAATQPGSAALALVAEFDRGFERWKATSLRVLEMARTDPAAASRLSFADSEAQFNEARSAIDKLGEMEDDAANALGTAAIARGDALVWQQGLIIAIGLPVCLVLVVGFPLLVTRPLHSLLHRIEPKQLSESGILATAKPTTLIDDFAHGLRDWYVLNAGNLTHQETWTRKITDPLYRGSSGAKLKLTLKMAKTNSIAIVLQQNEWRSYRGQKKTFICQREIQGADAEQTLVLETKDFTSPEGALTDWDQLDQLGICAHYSQRGAPAKEIPLWKGPAIELLRVEWS